MARHKKVNLNILNKISTHKKDDEITQEELIFQLKSMLDALPGDVYWKNIDGVWSGLNQHCVESLYRMGFIKKADKSYILGKTDYDIFNKETADGYRKNDLEVMMSRRETTWEEVTQLPDGSTVILLSKKSPFLDKNNNVIGVIGNSMDITARKIMEAELKIAKEKAEAANYIRTEFISNMGHDLATPIADVGYIAQMFQFYADEYPELNELFKDLEARAEACNQVRQTIINATSIANLEVKLDCFSTVHELLALEMKFRPIAEAKNLNFVIYPLKPKKDDQIETDRTKFRDILADLISNAINFTEQGQITISVLKQDDTFHIQVTDTGVGIPEDKFDYIFEQYTKLSRSNTHGATFKGVGAGLYLARIRANILNATIQVESELGKGSTFTLSIPAHR